LNFFPALPVPFGQLYVIPGDRNLESKNFYESILEVFTSSIRQIASRQLHRFLFLLYISSSLHVCFFSSLPLYSCTYFCAPFLYLLICLLFLLCFLCSLLLFILSLLKFCIYLSYSLNRLFFTPLFALLVIFISFVISVKEVPFH